MPLANIRAVGTCAVTAGALLAGCSRPETPEPQPAAAAHESRPEFVNKLWRVEASSGVAPGAIYAFLDDGALLITSAQSTPLVGSWELAGDTLVVIEEGNAYPATIREQSGERFAYTLHGPGEPLQLDFARVRGAGRATSASLLTGTVAYRERMALPPDASVTVRLENVSRQDAPARVVAETTFTPGGRQVPLPFGLRYDAKELVPRDRYAVRATIRSGQQPLFTTETHVPVTPGTSDSVRLTLVRVRTASQ